MSEKQQLGIALVGLGEYSGVELAPALKETKHCRLAAIVSDDDQEKIEKWKKEYGLEDRNCYHYKNFDSIKDNKEVDIVYIVLPNSLHEEFAVRAARAGKHVICEKPLSTSVESAQRTIEACNEAGVKLSMGYRLHFEPHNQEMMRLGQQKVFGKVTRILAENSMDVGEKGQWRLKAKLSGGGPLMNNGVYCIQGALYITGEMPVAVTARFLPKTDPQKFEEVEEGIRWEMEFPGGARAICETSYSNNANLLRADAEQGWFELSPAYEYKGLKGRHSQGVMQFPAINQQAAQMDDFAQCIKNNRESRVPGEMGLRDLRIITAIYESARTKKRIELDLEEFEAMAEK